MSSARRKRSATAAPVQIFVESDDDGADSETAVVANATLEFIETDDEVGPRGDAQALRPEFVESEVESSSDMDASSGIEGLDHGFDDSDSNSDSGDAIADSLVDEIAVDGPVEGVQRPGIERHMEYGEHADISEPDNEFNCDVDSDLDVQNVSFSSDSESSSTSSISLSDENDPPSNPYDYTARADRLTEAEKLSLAFHDTSITHHVPREAVVSFRSLHPLSRRPYEGRKAKTLIAELTRINEVRYDCCSGGCVSYALPKYNNLDHCPMKECGRPRYSDAIKKIAFSQHAYIPVAHRIKLRWADKASAREMLQHRAQCISDEQRGIRSDFWTGELFKDLRKKDLFPNITDMAFMLSSDGVKVFKARDDFSIWPLMLARISSTSHE